MPGPSRAPLAALTHAVRRLRRRVLLHRRPLAALAAAGAVLLVVQATSPAPAPTVTVWAAARSLPGGALLTGSSVHPVRVPPALVPEGAVRDPGVVVGRPLAAPVTEGELLTDLRVLGPGLSAAYPGSTAVPVRFADAEVVDLLRPGDRVDVVSAPADGRGGQARVLVTDVAVVAVPEAGNTAAGPGSPGRLVVLAVSDEASSDVAAATATSLLIPVWSD